MPDARLKIAVFIDFDNIEIGVKTTLGGHFDVGAVLEALKERGEVVTKIAYGDWTRAGDYSRSLTQHAIQMVQRNLTPGGDKNGADINLALDALELAFTHSHINAFVIVGGDSDFMALVEKLKLYDRQVFVVGGRAFTSVILQKNCTEFIAYEDLTGRRSSPRGGGARDVRDALPLVKRALKILADREVTPQLGVLKSTLLQLDSTFSEREFGVSTFRDFVQKLERAGGVTLRGTDRSLIVELKDGSSTAAPATPAPPAAAAPQAADTDTPAEGAAPEAADQDAPLDMPASEPPPPPVSSAQQAEGYAVIKEVFSRPGAVSRWPLYVRQAKQLLKNADDGFDERRYGFNGILDALRYCQREGLFRLDRDRQGVIRIYPGEGLPPVVQAQAADVLRGPKGPRSVVNARGGLAATLPLEDHVLDAVIDGNKLPPGESAVDVVPATAAPRRRGLQRRRLTDVASETASPETEPTADAPATPGTSAETADAGAGTPGGDEAAQAAEAQAATGNADAPSIEETAAEGADREPTDEAAASAESAAGEDAPATAAKRTTRKRATATKKRVAKKTTAKKTASKTTR